MKAFMEEYGLAIVVSILILALLGVAMFCRKDGTGSIRNTQDAILDQNSNSKYVSELDEQFQEDFADEVQNSGDDTGSGEE